MDRVNYYFSHDGNASEDPKLQALLAVHGVAGYGRYWLLVELIFNQKGYKLMRTHYGRIALAKRWQCDLEEADALLDFMINECHLFESDDQYIWSESLLRRMEHYEKKSKRRSEAAKKAAEARWQTADTKGFEGKADANGMRTHSERNANAMRIDAKEKEKEKDKEKDIYITPIPPRGNDVDADKAKPVKQTQTEILESRFDRFWNEYPKKVGKGAARKSWLKIKPSESLTEKMIASVQRQAESTQWQKDKGQFIPNPSTWLNQERWEDEPSRIVGNSISNMTEPTTEDYAASDDVAAYFRANNLSVDDFIDGGN